MKKIAILGSTGSIGTQTLEVINNSKDKFKLILLSAYSNYELLINQAKKFKPKIIIYNIVANDYVNSISGKYNFNLQNNQIFLKTSGTVEKKLIHKILLKSNFVRYLYYNLKPHHQLNYLLNMKNKKFEANIPCEYTDLELSENKKTFDLFLNYNKKFLDEGIKIILMFDPIRSKIYERNLNNCGFNDFESGLASKIREYSVTKIKPNGIYTLDLEAYFKSAYKKDAIKFEFKNDLHWNKYTHNLVSDIVIEYLSNQLIKY